MLFNSVEFFIFFVIVFSLYCIFNHRWQNRMLLAASYFFYGYWDWRFLSLIFISTAVDYALGLLIFDAKGARAKKKLVFLSVLVNLSFLGFFKYFNFFATNLLNLLNTFGLDVHPNLINIVLPVGISFYTFQSMSYTIDIYRGQLKPTKNFIDFALYVSFFPQLVAGPIERAPHLLPQIIQKRVVTMAGIYEGAYLIFWGLFEKVFIAGNLVKIVDPIFAKTAPYNGFEVLVALYAFAFQIFCDFDAYSNIAKGTAKCMGVELIFNFNLPYFSTSPREFWQRWHISLSSWLRDYLYIPLGGNRGSKWFNYRNLFLTMFLGGLWHGAAWTFILWGIYHGILLIGYRIIDEVKGRIKIFSLPPKLKFSLGLFIFFHLVIFSWLLFRAQSLPQVMAMSQGLLLNFNPNPDLVKTLSRLCLIIFPLLVVQIGQYRTKDLLLIYHQPWFIKTFIYALLAYILLGWGVMKTEEFIYFQF